MKQVERKREIGCSSCGGSGREREHYYNFDNYKCYTGKTIKCSSCGGSGVVTETYYESVCENQAEYNQEMVRHQERVNHNNTCDESERDWQRGLGEHYKSRYGDGSGDIAAQRGRRLEEMERLKPKKGW